MPTETCRLAAWLLAVVSICAAWSPTPVHAQTEDELERSREFFEEGSRATGEGRWADAEELFAESYELSRRPVALFNLALAQRSQGHHVDARDSLQRFMRTHLDASTELLSQVRTYYEEEASRVATLRFVGFEIGESYDFRIDGQVTTPRDLGSRQDLESDPGRHSVVIERDGFEPFAWEGVLTDGQSLEVPVSFTEIERESRIVESPWFWAVFGVVLVGGGVGTYFAVDGAVQLDTRPNVPVVEF